VNWVYGFRAHDVKKPLEYIKKGEVEKILYFTANIIVIYYPKLHAQKHYLEHDREVISLAVAKNKQLIASGELGDFPAIHIWDCETL
jgi:microtubule-associated protein-like 5